MKKHNFYAGPSILSEYTIKNTADAVLNFADTGLSLLEISHRSKEFTAVIEEAKTLVKELLEIPAGYDVLFLGGGASVQFCMVPYNLLNRKAAYIETGTWAVNDVYYFHFTSNNTIYGTEMRFDPDVNVPLVADMSSDIFSRPIDVSKYNVIYAGAQKNLAPAGVTIVIVKEEALGHVDRAIPTMLDYRTHIKKGSMFNTPPCLPIYSALQTLKYYKEMGGIKEMEKRDLEKAAILYDAIDSSKIFVGTAAHEDRSIMNVCFVMKEEYKDLESEFIEFASSQGMVGIKGHRSVGGFRASIYNAMPKSSVEALIATMKEFEKKH